MNETTIHYTYRREMYGYGLFSTEMKASDTLTKIIVFCLRLPFLVLCSDLSTALKVTDGIKSK